MVWAFLSGIGKLLWPAIGAVAPWGGPKLSMALAVALAALVAIGGPAGAVWLHMRGNCKAALATEKAQCDIRLANKETALQRTLSDILEANAKDDTEEPRTPGQEAELCAKSPFCIEGGSK